MELLAACLQCFGGGLILGLLPSWDAAIWLINHGDKTGWITPGFSLLGAVMIVIGCLI